MLLALLLLVSPIQKHEPVVQAPQVQAKNHEKVFTRRPVRRIRSCRNGSCS